MEKTKKITGKKQRKLSKITDPQIQADPDDGFIKDAELDNQQTQDVSSKDKPVPVPPNQESVSMESMVALTSQRLHNQFLTAINLLKCEKYKEAVEGLKVILASVQEQPNYGQYAISGRTKNKRTTLSALNMFTALGYEGMANPKKAIEFCNNAINEDPGWPIPFAKRSEYFSCLEQFFHETNGARKEEILRLKITADIIVDQKYIKEDEHEKGNMFTDL